MESLTIKYLQERVALERDETAFRELFHFYYNSLMGFVVSFLKSKTAAEEIVSDVMLNIWQMQKGLQKIEDLGVYLFRAAKNRALNYATRQNLSWNELTGEYIFRDTEPDPQDRLQTNELQFRLALAIQSLPPRCAAAYHLVKEEKLTYKQAAFIMGITENTVDRQLNIALHRLITAMKDYLDDLPSRKKSRPAVKIGRPARLAC